MQLLNVPILLSLLTAGVTGQQCCKFLESDASDCAVYGSIDGNVVVWSKANADCLATYNIRIDSIDVTTVGCGSTISTTAFVNAIRFESLPNSVRGGLGDFFVQQGNGVYELADSITVDGMTYSCEDSESSCYNAMRTYFESSSTGQMELNDVCETVRNKDAVDRELEQSTVRIQMCQDPTTGESICGALAQEVADRVAQYPNKQCSAFGFGPGTADVPGCDRTSSTTPTSGNGPAFTAVLGLLLAGSAILAL